VASNLAKIYPDELFFHRSDHEIDFIAKNRALEVKYQSKISDAEIKHILKFKGKRFILSKNELRVSQDYIILPVEFFLVLAQVL